ncbi:hypothetical protein MMC17_009658 [Xylographa soralifera]|nr:hypothetical protein [Xylographa soralifera]
MRRGSWCAGQYRGTSPGGVPSAGLLGPRRAKGEMLQSQAVPCPVVTLQILLARPGMHLGYEGDGSHPSGSWKCVRDDERVKKGTSFLPQKSLTADRIEENKMIGQSGKLRWVPPLVYKGKARLGDRTESRGDTVVGPSTRDNGLLPFF